MATEKEMTTENDSIGTPRRFDINYMTGRTKIDYEKNKTNNLIRKETQISSAAKKMLEITRREKFKQPIKKEILNSEMTLTNLKHELDTLNSQFEAYQDIEWGLPMIPSSIKQTNALDFWPPFSEYIKEHYYEDPDVFYVGIKNLTELRQKVTSPKRTPEWLAFTQKYFNLLNIISDRFYPPERPHNISYTWYDSLTGIPFQQRTIIFEKGSILFNLAALYSQIACGHERNQLDGLKKAQEDFCYSAGTFKYLKETFANSPSTDMKIDVLETFMILETAQAQECVYLELVLNRGESERMDPVSTACEAAFVSSCYGKAYNMLVGPLLHHADYIPQSWNMLICIKINYYLALANHWLAKYARGVLEGKFKDTTSVEALGRLFAVLDNYSDLPEWEDSVAGSDSTLNQLKVYFQEEAVEQILKCRYKTNTKTEYSAIESVKQTIDAAHEMWSLELEIMKRQVSDSVMFKNSILRVKALSQRELTPQPPPLSSYPMVDPFRSLGPPSVFCASRAWTLPRTLILNQVEDKTYGFGIKGDAPVVVVAIEKNSEASQVGMKKDDIIVAVGDTDARWSKHNEVVTLVKESTRLTGKVTLKLVSRVDSDWMRNGGFRVNENNPFNSVPICKGSGSNKSEGKKWRKRLSGTWFSPKRSVSSLSRKSNPLS